MKKLIKWNYLISKEQSYFWLFIYYSIKKHLPWANARELLAFYKYLETPMYKERVEVMNKKFALEIYSKKEKKLFFQKITFREKLGIILKPYSYIEKYRDLILKIH